MKTRNVVIGVLGVMLSTGLWAQEEESFNRKGLVFGVGVGGGAHSGADVVSARVSAPSLRIGYAVNNKWAVLIHAPGGTYQRNGESRAFEGIIPTAQYWLHPKLYVNAGVGLAIETTPFYQVDAEQGPPTFNSGLGVFSSLGYEVLQWGGNKTMDLQLRCLYGNVGTATNLRENHLGVDFIVGINLY